MAEITTTQAFSDGDTVTATKLNNITANAAIQTEAITNRSAETTVDQANDLLLMYDASASALKKVSLSNVVKAGTASNFPVTGNATVGGTLGVTGASTLSSTLGVSDTISATKASGTGLAVTSNATIGGTLGVTGASTLSGNTTVGGTLGVTGAITASSTVNGTTIPTGKTLVTTNDSQTLTNKTLTSPVISSISNTGTITLPTSTDTLVGRATTDTLTNKTLTSPAINTGTISGGTINNAVIGGTTAAAGSFTTLSATSPITTQAGTASAPAIQPTGDTNTGIFFPAADTIAFSEGGTESMRIDSSGRVGIGTTSPAVKLDVSNGNIQGKEIFLQNGAASSPALGTTPSWYSPASGVAALSTNATERLRIDSSGNVGIGVTPSAWGSSFVGLQVGGASSIWTDKTNGLRTFLTTNAYFDGTNRRYLGNGAASEYVQGSTGEHIFYTAGSGTAGSTVTFAERLRIDSSGRVGIGDASPANKLELVGSFGRGAPVTKTADFTLADTENWIINNKSGSTCTVTLPAASSWTGREFTIKNLQAQTVVSASSNVVPRNGTAAGTAILASGAGNWATLVSNGTNWVIMCGS